MANIMTYNGADIICNGDEYFICHDGGVAGPFDCYDTAENQVGSSDDELAFETLSKAD